MHAPHQEVCTRDSELPVLPVGMGLFVTALNRVAVLCTISQQLNHQCWQHPRLAVRLLWHASWGRSVCRKAQKAEGDLRRATADLRAREREREAAELRAAAAQAESEKGSSSSSVAVAAKRVRNACLCAPLFSLHSASF